MPTIKKSVTLAEIHSWIEDARKLFTLADGSLAEELEIRLDAEDEELAAIAKLTRTINKLVAAVNNFDCLFHDLFGCR